MCTTNQLALSSVALKLKLVWPSANALLGPLVAPKHFHSSILLFWVTVTVQRIQKTGQSVLSFLLLQSQLNTFQRLDSLSMSFSCDSLSLCFLCHCQGLPQFNTFQRLNTQCSSFFYYFQISIISQDPHHLSCVTFSSAHSKDPSPVSCHFQFSTLQRPITCLLSLSVHHIPNQTSSFLWYFQFSQPWTPHLSCVTLSSAPSQDQTLPLSLALRSHLDWNESPP